MLHRVLPTRRRARAVAGIAAVVLGTVGFASAQLGPATSFNVGPNPDSVATGDFDGDTDLDLVTAVDAPDRIVVAFNDGNGGFGNLASFQTGGSGAQAVATADFDVDGDVDVAVTLHNTTAVRIMVNNGSGSFSQGSLALTGPDPRSVRVANFNGGAPDLVTANEEGNSATVLLNTGIGSFATQTYPTGVDARDVNVGDLNGDSDIDFVVAIHDDRRLDLFANNGNGSFSPAGSVSLGGDFRPDGVVAADLDDDGDLDLASAVSDDAFGAVARLFNTGAGSGAGSFGSLQFFGTNGGEPQKIVAADFDIDGDVDVATANETANNVSVLPNTGSGSFGGPATFQVGSLPQDLVAADLDDNGSPDLAVANEGSGSISVLLNVNGGDAFTDLGLGLAGAAGIPQLDGDGTLQAGTPVSVTLTGAAPSALSAIVIGLSRIDAPFKGGTLVPAVDLLVVLTTSPAGTLTLSGTFPAGVPSGTDFFVQVIVTDAGAVQGFALSNAIQGTTP